MWWRATVTKNDGTTEIIELEAKDWNSAIYRLSTGDYHYERLNSLKAI